MDKQPLITQIIDQLQQQLDEALQAAEEAHLNATNSESIAETQYDTIGLENAYLAHGQSMRSEGLIRAISRYQNLPLRAFEEDDEIAVGALVTLESEQGEQCRFLIGPEAGGLVLMLAQQPVTLITPETPAGQQLMQRQRDDEVELRRAGQLNRFIITDIA
ncbi:GreA/GreB family elongation factor [Marinobacterium jannaschii]|uniref:GreA/GreB family elongation factor n=1 Tax=Marinobacterium jannaschii TaxID=64970 RepID=UPI000488E04A|nr:GreA/GreB family elongation factor [Marinobacterium jannaschii]